MKKLRQLTEHNTVCSTAFILFFIALLYDNVAYAAESKKSVSNNSAVSQLGSSRNQNVLSIPRLVATEAISKYAIIDPHWDVKQCGMCHNGTPTKANLKLHIRDVNKLCESCHQFIPVNLLNHPVNVKPDSGMLKRMSPEYKKTLSTKLARKGTVSCLTCHDVIQQCTPAKFFNQGKNSEFFRNGPFRGRTQQCFQCHNKNNFKRFNPHKQVAKSGAIIKSTCYVCHKDVTKLATLNSPADLKFNVSDYSKMCTGCHVWKPHPGGELSFGSKKKPNHLVVASDKVVQQMKLMLPKQKMYVPLEPGTGKVHCASCHNVHEKGVIKDKMKAMGADSERRVRRKEMCKICHPI